MNLIISESRNTDIELAEAGHLFLGVADSRIGEVHVFLKAGESLAKLPLAAKSAEPAEENVDYVKIRITSSTDGMQFPYGCLSQENKQFVKDFIGEEFQAVRFHMNYYKLKNGMLVHIYNAFEIPKKS